jgi:hypothetical protein
MIALPRSHHELSLHLAPRRWRADLAALDEYGETSLALVPTSPSSRRSHCLDHDESTSSQISDSKPSGAHSICGRLSGDGLESGAGRRNDPRTVVWENEDR